MGHWSNTSRVMFYLDQKVGGASLSSFAVDADDNTSTMNDKKAASRKTCGFMFYVGFYVGLKRRSP